MIIIFYRHTESYENIPGLLENTTAMYYVNAFFVTSGYLHFKKYLSQDVKISDELKNILFKLFIPVIIFSAVQYIPKTLVFHNQDFSLLSMTAAVLGGTASWFVAALISAKILLILMFVIFRKRFHYYFITSIILAALSCYLTQLDSNPFPWFYKSGMAATLFITFGGAIYYYDLLSKRRQSVTLLISGIILIIWSLTDFSAMAALRSCKINLWGTAVSFASCYLSIQTARLIPQNRILDFIGKNSILFYFFCNSVPAALCTAARKFFGISGNYNAAILITALSLATTSILIVFIRRFAPFLLDLRKIDCNRFYFLKKTVILLRRR